MPRFTDLTSPDQMINDHFTWFQTAHDFSVPSDRQVERDLKLKILSLKSKKVQRIATNRFKNLSLVESVLKRPIDYN